MQTTIPFYPVETRGRAIEPSLWIPLICPFQDCDRPFYAVYYRPAPGLPYAPDYQYRYSTPAKPPTQKRDASLEAISPEFYDILDQAVGAETYHLNLIAGMGYRKALEYLVKDYVTAEIRARLNKAQNDGDDALITTLRNELISILEKPLAAIIKLIPDPLTSQSAERCAWLGNDESHYTRVWTAQDVGDMKDLLGIVMTFIANSEKAKAYIEKMNRRA